MSLPSHFAFEVASLKAHILCAQAQWTGLTLLKTPRLSSLCFSEEIYADIVAFSCLISAGNLALKYLQAITTQPFPQQLF